MFHIDDDLLMSHMILYIITKYIKLHDDANGSKDLLLVIWGKLHKYLSITINFLKYTSQGIIYVRLHREDLQWSLDCFKKGPYRATQASEDLFKVNLKLSKLENKKKVVYHIVTAKTL